MKTTEKYTNEAIKNKCLKKVLKKEENKCKNCPWGTFISTNKYLCMFPKCKRDLGSDDNEQT